MLTHTVPIDDDTDLTIASAKSGAAGVSLTVVDHGVARTSVYLPGAAPAHLLLAALIDATRHMGWLSDRQAVAMVAEMQAERRPWWRRWRG